jgi:FAD/FMN-containing dehydrogenase
MSTQVLDGLRALVTPSAVLTAPEDKASYLTDWRGREKGDALCVVLPSTTQEVSSIVWACAQQGVPVFPQGGNTSLCVGAIPSPGGSGVVVSLSRLSRIRAVDKADNSMIVEAGCILANIHAAADTIDRIFPLSLGAEGSCQIGGNISTNAGGTGVLRYGNTRDLVLGLEVVLPDGRIWNGLKTLRKDNTGYDLKNLFIGAEGTLGIVTAAALKIFPKPKDNAHAWIGVSDPGAGVSLLSLFQETFDTKITAFEMMSKSEVDIVLRHVPDTRLPLTQPQPWYIVVELSDVQSTANLTAQLETCLQLAAEKGLIADAVIAQSGAQAQSFWKIRHSVSEANKDHGIGITLDIGVPVSQVPGFIARANAAMQSTFPEAEIVIVCHLGDGNVHYIAMFDKRDLRDPAKRKRVQKDLERLVHDIAAEFGGTFSAEHGIGQKLKGELARYKSAVELDMFRALKAALDPAGLMNPGKLLPDS